MTHFLQACSSKQQCTRISFQFPKLHCFCLLVLNTGQLYWFAVQYFILVGTYVVSRSDGDRFLTVHVFAHAELHSDYLAYAVFKSQSAQVYINAHGNKLDSLLWEELNTTFGKVCIIESLQDGQKFHLRYLVHKKSLSSVYSTLFSSDFRFTRP